MAKIKLQFYNLIKQKESGNLAEIFESMYKQEYINRIKKISDTNIRLDYVEKINEKINGKELNLVYFSFSRLRNENLPNITKLTEAPRPLEIEDDEYLSETTYGLLDEKNKRVVIQYNHFGIRYKKILDYINFGLDFKKTFELLPVLKKEGLKILNKKDIITSVDAVIDGVSDIDLAESKNLPCYNTIKDSKEIGSQTVALTFKVNSRIKTNKLNKGIVSKITEYFINRNNQKDRLIIKCRENLDSEIEIIDILNMRAEFTFEANKRNYELNLMKRRLKEALNEWDRNKNK